MRTINSSKIGKEISLADGSRIVLLDMLMAPPTASDIEVERNVYKISPRGDTLWQIDVGPGVYPRTPFTGIYFDDDAILNGYRWDGTLYAIDLATGKATPIALIK